jgi:hypothetical protein
MIRNLIIVDWWLQSGRPRPAATGTQLPDNLKTWMAANWRKADFAPSNEEFRVSAAGSDFA